MKTRVQEIMSRPVVSCQSWDSVSTAAQLMWDHDCGSVAVVDGSSSLVGIITDRDIAMAAHLKGKSLDQMVVGDVMAKRVYTCQGGDSIEVAEQIMSQHQIRRVPVIDGDNRPIGMLSLNDIARVAGGRKQNGIERDLARTLAAISQPRFSAIRRAEEQPPMP